ncbi:ISAzo13-like element transposase-related protein [Parashewanella spongiae]|nr:hypothetical protein [Parashewanella spongiae]
MNKETTGNKKVIRISIDCKATVNVGEYSRYGKSRSADAVQALDHDMEIKKKMIPFGILNLDNDQLHVFYGNSNKTSDFICDALEWWWDSVKSENLEVEELIIFSDNGPENSGCRTQYLFRLVAFSEQSKLKIRNVYYPPYHSKYNPIERVWSSLERHWNGTLLSTAKTVIEWTKTMTWKAMSPVVNLIDKIYSKGVKLNNKEKEELESKIVRNSELPKWDLTITPIAVDF